jgi:formiminoglutamate deiminase
MRAFANCHSHVFHRALRGRAGGDSFWSWRDDMYALAAVLDPDLMFRLAWATYAEMRLAGIDAVGEFHYVHHQPDGTPYDDPNAMGETLIEAAHDVGLRICLLDTCYLTSGFDRGVEGVQRRFDDGDAEQWAARVGDLADRHAADAEVVIGAAVHSVRAVPREQLPLVADAFTDAPLHVHVSEQPAENKACLAATGMTPVALLDWAGVWTPRTTAVHATHLTGNDIRTLGDAGSFVCICPTTEADLADGIGPSVALRDAGARLTLGSDGHTVIDMFAEARAVELHERLASGRRGSWSADQLWDAATTTGHASLGFEPAATIELVPSVRTAGSGEPPSSALWSATAADVVPPADLDPSEVAADLAAAVDDCWSRV